MAGVFELPVLDATEVPYVPEAMPVAAAVAAAQAGPSPQDIVAQAHAEAEAIRAQAREDGFAAGLQAAQGEVATTGEALAAALASVAELRGEVADQVERGAVALGLRIAEQALGAAIEVDPDRVVDTVRGALRRLTERERVTILVNPADLDTVRAATADLMARLGGIDSCDVQAERRVSRGGAVVRTVEGEVDATLETKLLRARDILLSELSASVSDLVSPEVAELAEDRLERLAELSLVVGRSDLYSRHGRVTDLIGLIVEASGLEVEVGEVCDIGTGRGRPPVPAEVVGFRARRTLLMPLGEMAGIGPGNPVTATGKHLEVPVGVDLLGRVLDGLGRPMDGLGDLGATTPRRPANASPPDPLTRPRIHDRVSLGVRALDSLVPCGQGQRLGIFAGSGVGKSSLLGMIARSTSADVNVICLVGERGREVREFIERDLGDAIERSVVIVATSDQPALVRIKAALTATTIAESFRDAGADVMLMMDSVTRFAMAQREVGLAIGEPPATRGYTPSVFALLPKLLERSGTSATGSITGLYTVLVDGDDMNEPIADAVRSILDGHIVLTRELAHAGHYPAIDVLQSVSRLTSEVLTPEMQAAGQRVRALMAAYHDKRDLIAIGAYEPGSDPLTDQAVALRDPIDGFLRQHATEPSNANSADAGLLGLAQAAPAPALATVPEVVPNAGYAPPPGAAASPSAIPPLNLAV